MNIKFLVLFDSALDSNPDWVSRFSSGFSEYFEKPLDHIKNLRPSTLILFIVLFFW